MQRSAYAMSSTRMTASTQQLQVQSLSMSLFKKGQKCWRQHGLCKSTLLQVITWLFPFFVTFSCFWQILQYTDKHIQNPAHTFTQRKLFRSAPFHPHMLTHTHEQTGNVPSKLIAPIKTRRHTWSHARSRHPHTREWHGFPSLQLLVTIMHLTQLHLANCWDAILP